MRQNGRNGKTRASLRKSKPAERYSGAGPVRIVYLGVSPQASESVNLPPQPSGAGVPRAHLELAAEVVARAVREQVRAELLGEPFGGVKPATLQVVVLSGAQAAGAAGAFLLYAYAGARALAMLGHEAHPIVGAAAWSVGPGRRDILCHGLDPWGRPRLDVARRDLYARVVTPDLLFDFSTDTLPEKLRNATNLEPFDTPPSLWRRFPVPLVHPRWSPMISPAHSAAAAHAYWECDRFGEALRQLERQHAGVLRRVCDRVERLMAELGHVPPRHHDPAAA